MCKERSEVVLRLTPPADLFPQEETLFEAIRILFGAFQDLCRSAAELLVAGARKEVKVLTNLAFALGSSIVGTERAASIVHSYRAKEWGDGSSTLLQSFRQYSVRA